MKLLNYAFALLLLSAVPAGLTAQYSYEASESFPFGRLNPGAHERTGDFDPLIGLSECTSVNRAPDGTWNPEVSMEWKFKYIMNGLAVQDETLKSDGLHSGSIRQFNADSLKWYVHYYAYSGAAPALPSWEGSRHEDGRIILYREQQSPNGLDGYYRLTFYDISREAFKWIGEWVSTDESFAYPTWKINCTKKRS